jgi:hypothetical protein
MSKTNQQDQSRLVEGREQQVGIDRLEYARWVLERNLHWISVVETKTAVIMSVDTAMLGALAVVFGALDPAERSAWGILWLVLASVPLCASVIYGALAVWPQTAGPANSFIFFEGIKRLTSSAYRRQFLDANEGSLTDDCLAQVHRNAEIASSKFAHVKTSLKLAVCSLPVWVVAILKLAIDNQ